MTESHRKMMEALEAAVRRQEREDDDEVVPVRAIPIHERASCAEDMPDEELDWLWPGRVPFGEITAIFGPMTIGKSVVAIDLIARVTNGAPWPDVVEAGVEPEDLPGRFPGSVIVIATKEDHGKVVRPQLKRARADLARIHFLPYAPARVKSATTFRAREIDDWEKLADKIPDLRMLIIDPFALLLGSAIDRRTGELADILERLARFARDRQVAVVLVNATDKVSAGKNWTHGMDALPYIRAAATSVWEIQVDSTDPNSRLFLPAKVGPDCDPAGLSFTVDKTTRQIVWNTDPVWLRVGEKALSRRESTDVARAKAWVETFLADGPRLADDVLREGAAAGHSRYALYGAKQGLKVKSGKETERFNGVWFWEMPEGAPKPASSHEDSKVRSRHVRERAEGRQAGRNEQVAHEDSKMRSRDMGERAEGQQAGRNEQAGHEDSKMRSDDVDVIEAERRAKADWDQVVADASDTDEQPLFPELNAEPYPETPAHVLAIQARMREAGIDDRLIWDGSDRPKRPGTPGARPEGPVGGGA